MEISEKCKYMIKVYKGTLFHEGQEKNLVIDKFCCASLKELKAHKIILKKRYPEATKIQVLEKFGYKWQEIDI